MVAARSSKRLRLVMAALIAIAVVSVQQIQSADADQKRNASSTNEPELVADPDCEGPEAVGKHDIYVDGQRVGGGEGAYVGSPFHGWQELLEQGDEVEVRFEVEDGCGELPFALVTYETVEPYFRAETASRQVRSDYETVTASDSDGVQTLTATIPDCYFQLDFVHDRAYQRLTADTYKDTLIAAAVGGENACAESAATTTTSSTTTSSTTTSTTTTTEAPEPVCPSQFDQRIENYEVEVTNPTTSSNGVEARSTAVYDQLEGNVQSGARVQVRIQLAEGCRSQLTLASYEAESASNSRDAVATQTLFDYETKTVGDSETTLTVDVPDCFFQVDFATGPVIRDLAREQYGNRLIDSDIGGQACEEPEVLEETTVREEPKAQPQAEPVAESEPDEPRQELAYTGTNMFAMFATAVLLTMVGAFFLGSARAYRRRYSWDVW